MIDYSKKIVPVILEIKPTKMLPGEIGVFATKKLKSKTIVGEVKLYDNEDIIFISWSEHKKFDIVTQKKINEYCLGTPEGFYIPINLNHISIPWHLNHSCDYNVGFDLKGNFITVRRINKGEELYWDYGLAETNPNFKMICKCGSKKCREIITGNDWKDPNFRLKNLKFMLSNLKNI